MGLSETEKLVLEELKAEGIYLWTNEGKTIRAWLGDSKGTKIKGIKLSTLKSLVRKRYVEFTTGPYRDRIYKYVLVKE